MIHNTTVWSTSLKEMEDYMLDRALNHDDFGGYTIILQYEYVDEEVPHLAEYGDISVVTKPAWAKTVTNKVCKYY